MHPWLRPPDEVYEGDSVPAGGWDGAPAWATFDGGEPRCESGGQRELDGLAKLG
jgi:hypothetical protein